MEVDWSISAQSNTNVSAILNPGVLFDCVVWGWNWDWNWSDDGLENGIVWRGNGSEREVD